MLLLLPGGAALTYEAGALGLLRTSPPALAIACLLTTGSPLSLDEGTAKAASVQGVLQVSAMVQDSCNVEALVRGPGEAPQVSVHCSGSGPGAGQAPLGTATSSPPAHIRTERRGRLEIVDVQF